MQTAIVYCRTSTARQENLGTIATQRAVTRKLVDAHKLKVVRSIEDDGCTGSLLEGRSFGALIDELEAGRMRFDVLVVASMSRLARLDQTSRDMCKLVRSATDTARIQAVLIGAGVKILDGEGVHDPRSALYGIKNVLSADEYATIRRRTLDGKARVLAAGGNSTGGRVAYGYMRVKNPSGEGTTLAAHPVDADRFRQVMRWYLGDKGGSGVSYAARRASEEGWPSPRGSKIWWPTAVQQLADRARDFLGESTRTVDGQTFVIKYPALITHETYARIVRRTKERTLKTRAVLLSTGLLDCSCGAHVQGATSSAGNRVKCGRRVEGSGTKRQSCGSEKEETLIAALWNATVLRLKMLEDAETGGGGGGAKLDREIAATRAAAAKVQTRLDKLVELYTDGSIDREAMTKQNEKLRGAKADAQAELERLEARKRETAEQAANARQVQSKIGALLRQAKNVTLAPGSKPKVSGATLEKRREILRDVLGGGRVVVKFGERPTLTFPAIGSLKPWTCSIDTRGRSTSIARALAAGE